MTFKDFINEGVQLTHLEHVEDILLDQGKAGGYAAIEFLQKVYSSLKNSSNEFHTIQAKVDGAPAVIAGWDPESGKFFVGTKSLFNKTPKINFTPEDVDNNHGHSAGLAQKLKEALEYLPKVIKKGEILQGDFMFGKGDVSTSTIDGEKCLIFQPNTITYAVPLSSKLANIIQKAKIGVIFHTSYSGPDILNLSASFDIHDSQFQRTSDVYCRTTNVTDIGSSLQFTPDEDKFFQSEIKRLTDVLNKFDESKLSFLLKDPNVVIKIKTYINGKVRLGTKIDKNEIKHFVDYLMQGYDKEIEKLKSDTAKDKKQIEKYTVIAELRKNFSLLYSFFYWHDEMQTVKEMLIQKLNTMATAEIPYIKTSNGFEPTDPEGFVIASSSETAVKFVNRKVFSQLNFNLGKMGNK